MEVSDVRLNDFGERRFSETLASSLLPSSFIRERCYRGFPSRACCVCFNPKLRIFAIGTADCQLRLYGQNRTFHAIAQPKSSPQKAASLWWMRFLSVSTNTLLCVLNDGTMQLWELNSDEDRLALVRSFDCQLEADLPVDRCKQSVCLLESVTLGSYTAFGLTNSKLALVNLSSSVVSPAARLLDPLRDRCDEDSRPPVQALCPHPSTTNQLLIAYRHSFVVLYDWCSDTPSRIFEMTTDDLPAASCLTLTFDGSVFVTGHEDGTCLVWNETADRPKMFMPYGPFPKSPINSLTIVQLRHQRLWIQSGGLPRPQYSDKHTLTLAFESEQFGDSLSAQSPQKHVTFEFSSRVLDNLIIRSLADQDRPVAVIVLLDEELVAIDLCSEQWPTFRLPYLQSIHSSPLTACESISVRAQHFLAIQSRGSSLLAEIYSDRPWPLFVGSSAADELNSEDLVDLLVTGHADGSVCFWDLRTNDFLLLYRIETSIYYRNQLRGIAETESVQGWPPFRPTGNFNPKSANPDISIKCIAQDSSSTTQSANLAIGTNGGYVFVFELAQSPIPEINPHSQLLVQHPKTLDDDETMIRNECIEFKTAGYRAKHIFQMTDDDVGAVGMFGSCVIVLCSFSFSIWNLDKLEKGPCEFVKISTLTNDSADASSGDEQKSGAKSSRSIKNSVRSTLRRRFRTDSTANDSRTTMINLAFNAKRSISNAVLKYLTVNPIDENAARRGAKNSTEHVVCGMFYIHTFLVTSHSSRQGSECCSQLIYILIGHQSSVQVYTFSTNSGSVRLLRTLRFKGSSPQKIVYITSLQMEKSSLGRHSGTLFRRSWLDSNTSGAAQRPYTLICTNQQIKLISLTASNASLKTISKCRISGTSGSILKASLVNHSQQQHPNSRTLCLLMTSGTLALVALPSLKILQKCSNIPPIMWNLTFLRSSNRLLVQISSSELQEFWIEPGQSSAGSPGFTDLNLPDKRLAIANMTQRFSRQTKVKDSAEKTPWRMLWSLKNFRKFEHA